MTTIAIPRGDGRTNATLFHMRRLVDRGVRNPLTVRLAGDIVAGVLGNRSSQGAAIRGWLDHVTEFLPDPWGVETLRTVREMLYDLSTRGAIFGDCDDVAIMAAALGKAVGMRARFVVLGFGGPAAPFEHVFTELAIDGGRWLELDVTRPATPFPPPTRASILEV